METILFEHLDNKDDELCLIFDRDKWDSVTLWLEDKCIDFLLPEEYDHVSSFLMYGYEFLYVERKKLPASLLKKYPVKSWVEICNVIQEMRRNMEPVLPSDEQMYRHAHLFEHVSAGEPDFDNYDWYEKFVEEANWKKFLEVQLDLFK